MNNSIYKYIKIAINGTWVDNDNILLTPPPISMKTEDIEGQFVDDDVDIGVEKLAPKLTIGGLPTLLLNGLGVCANAGITIQYYAAIEDRNCGVSVQKGIIQAKVKKLPETQLKPGKIEGEIELGNVTRFSEWHDDVLFHDIRPKEDRVFVAGQDILGEYKAKALG